MRRTSIIFYARGIVANVQFFFLRYDCIRFWLMRIRIYTVLLLFGLYTLLNNAVYFIVRLKI